MLTIPVSNIMYTLLNNSNRGTHSLVTDLDQSIPFLKIFILPYLMWYVFILLTLAYFCFKDKKIYYRTMWAINLGLLISYGFYYFFQTNVPRPELQGNDFLTLLTSFVYHTDQPYNAFPSIHVLLSFLMIKAINKCSDRNIYNITLVYLPAILIILATQFVKQHVLLDLFSAVAIGGLVFDFVFHLKVERVFSWLNVPYLGSIIKKRPEVDVGTTGRLIKDLKL